jgi:metal-responsive CopG/Arc/MetJ family transcriptional regulator
MQSSIAVGISLPKELISKIDDERGDISRSRYLLRILEKVYEHQKNSERLRVNKKDNGDPLDSSGFESLLQSSGSENP